MGFGNLKKILAFSVFSVLLLAPAGSQLAFSSHGFCSSDSQCNDQNPCTNDNCSGIGPARFCTHFGSPSLSGNTCGDQTTTQCSNPNTCNSLGGCSARNTSGSCNDSNACTSSDICVAGICGGNPVPQIGRPLCDDGKECTIGDQCGALGGCIGDPIGQIGDSCGPIPTDSCNSGGLCGAIGNCVNVPFTGLPCDDNDSNVCTTGFCNTSIFTSGGATCDAIPTPGLPCGETARGCFLADLCDGSGVCQTDLPAVGLPCNDNNSCTGADFCNTSGDCNGIPVLQGTLCGNSADNDCTNPDRCNGQGTCQSNDEPDDTSCDDGEVCTIGELCIDGVCGMGTTNPILACMPDGGDGQSVGGDIIPIEATSLILAGTQTTISWLIPVTVSAIGIAIVIAREFSKYQPD